MSNKNPKYINKKNSIYSLQNISDKYIKIDGLNYSKITDSVQLLTKKYNLIEIMSSDQSENHFNKNNIVIAKYYYRYKLFSSKRKITKNLNFCIQKLNTNLQQSKLKKINTDSFFKTIEEFIIYTKVFKKVLKKGSPKATLIGCYYTPSGFALSYMSNKLKIPSFEIQHGAQGIYQPMYSKFEKVPKKGYQIMPKYFGMWNNESAKIINNWAINSEFHKAVVIGNPWFEVLNRNILKISLNFKEKELIQKLNSMKQKGIIRILFSLQAWADFKDIIPPFIIQLMKRENNIFWCLRAHPSKNNKNYIHNLTKHLLDNNCHNFEIEITSNIKLFSLLKASVFTTHITLYSSVAIESLEFQLNTIILSKEGYNSYKDKIDEGIFDFCDNEKDFMTLLSKKKIKKVKTNNFENNFMNNILNIINKKA